MNSYILGASAGGHPLNIRGGVFFLQKERKA